MCYILYYIQWSNSTIWIEISEEVLRFLYNQRSNRRPFIIITKDPYGYKKFCDGREKGSHWKIVSHEGAIGERLEWAVDSV